MNEFENQVAVVTGASGGLGRAICIALAERGARIVAFDRDEQALDLLSSELTNSGAEPLSIAGDITDVEAVRDLAQRVEEHFGAVDVLIHNAGVTHFSRFAESGPSVTSRVMAVNFTGAVELTYALLPMIRESRGSIVAVSSVAGFAPLYARTGYAASKHALHGFFESLRGELADDGVHVMLACPSFIATQEQSSGADRTHGVSRPGSATATAGRPLEPAYVAARILDGVQTRERQLVIGRVAKLSWLISRLFPALFERKMLQSTRAEVAED